MTPCADISARAEISADTDSAQNSPILPSQTNSFADTQLTMVKARAALAVLLPIASVGEVNCNHASSYY
jgi:hypothetical protein